MSQKALTGLRPPQYTFRLLEDRKEKKLPACSDEGDCYRYGVQDDESYHGPYGIVENSFHGRCRYAPVEKKNGNFGKIGGPHE